MSPTGGSRFAGLVTRLRGLFGRDKLQDRADEEFRLHLEMETDRNIKSGMSPAQARRAALVAFGGRTRFREDATDELSARAMVDLGHDLRYGSRVLRRSPGFTAVAVLTLALGIGATTVFFSVADHVVLRPLPYPEAGRLVVVREIIEELASSIPILPANASHYLEWRRVCTGCERIEAARGWSTTLTGTADAQRLIGARVSAGFLPLLGATAQLGRLFTEPEDRHGADRVVVLSDGLWRRLGADPSLVGKTITLAETEWLVVGVLARGFRFPRWPEFGRLAVGEADVFAPLALTPREMTTPGEFDYTALARLRSGVTATQLQAELDGIANQLAARSSEKITLRTQVVPLQRQVVGSSGRVLLLLLGAVIAVLLVVCVNLANLLLARNLARSREWAVRVALGAGRGRLLRQALTESLLLAVAGGLLGVVLSRWGLAGVLSLAPHDLPRLAEIRLDARVMGVALGLSVLAGLIFGALPAFRLSRAAPGDVLRGGGRSSTDHRGAGIGPNLLIGSQVGISAMLLIATGLFVTSFVNVLRIDRGFTGERVLALDVVVPLSTYDTDQRRTVLFDELLGRLAARPAVTSVGLATAIPLEGDGQVDLLSEPDDPRPPNQRPPANIVWASPGYFTTLGIRMTRGRAFAESDRGRPVVVISERAAKTLWPGGDPIGKLLLPGSNDSLSEVIGIAADVKTALEKDPSLVAYLPYWSNPPPNATLVLRTAGDPVAHSAMIRDEIRSLAPRVPVSGVRTLTQVVSNAVAGRRFQVLVLVIFGLTALVTAAVGIYGIIAHSVGRRTAEIGLRMALGARPADVHRLILREGLRPVFAGLFLGLLAAIALGRGLATLLFQVRPTDPLTLGAVTVLFTVVGLIACWIPARRAIARGSLVALRSD